MPTLALLDGHSLAYRAFFALPQDLGTTSGQITNATYGFLRMLIKLLGDHRPDRLAVAWDTGRATFRSEQYPEYKAQRDKTPDIFASQLPLIDDALEALGITQFRVPGYEADDVIASLARQAEREGWNVLVVTGDRDAFQLVDDHVTVLYTRRGITDTVLATTDWITDKYGIGPEQYVEYAALRGDTSDNLPGVDGVGEKTAARLLNAHGSLEGIFAALDEQTPRLRENLAAAREQVFLNRRLMALVADLELGVEPDELEWTRWDESTARELFERLEFASLWADLTEVHPTYTPTGEVLDIDVVVATMEDVGALTGPLAVEPVVEDGRLSGVMVAAGPDRAHYLARDGIPERWELGEWYAHDAKALLSHTDLVPGTPVFDTALAAYVINPTGRGYSLPEVAERYLGIEVTSPDAEEPAGQGSFSFGDRAVDLEAPGKRAVAIWRLVERLGAELEDRAAMQLFRDIELPLIPVLLEMERRGIGIDRAYLEEFGQRLREELADLEHAIHEAAGAVFNVNSANQLREVLFEQLGLPVIKKTSKGAPSTDASVLQKLAEEHPIVESLLRYRELEKLRSTYIDALLPLIGPDERIHTTFNQMAATTGRLSSDNPNLQNIPVRSETGRLIRRAFVPAPGNVFLVGDYSQIELRILAHMSGDAGLLEAFVDEDRDIHTATAASVFGLDDGEVTPELRRRAKAINFGLLYGMEAFGLADRLGISRDEARGHMDAYFATFPSVKAFMESIVEDAKARGYTETMFGRRRYLPELRSDRWQVRQMGERMALNAPIQGTAADIIKMAMLDVDRLASRLGASLLLQIHDELVLEMPEERLDEVRTAVVGAMEGVTTLRVPLSVSTASGHSLADVKT